MAKEAPKKSFLSRDALKKMAAAQAPLKAKATTEKQTTRKAKVEKEKEVKTQARKQSFKENISTFANNLESGKLTSKAELKVPEGNAPNKISNNTSYHTALSAIMDDFDQRVGQVERLSQKSHDKDMQALAEKQGTTVDKLDRTSTAGILDTTLDRMNPSRSMISKARQALTQSWLAHHAGDHISAAEHFTTAADNIAAALRHINSPAGLGKKTSEYSEMFKDVKYGSKNNPLKISYDTAAKLTAAQKGYVNHALTNGVNNKKVLPEIANEVSSALDREYDTDLQPDYIKKALGRHVELTDEESEAQKQFKQEKKARIAENRARQNAITSGHTFAMEPREGEEPSQETFERVMSRADETRLRTLRGAVQPQFESEENKNAASAAAAGKDYTKKTFIGSEAHTDPTKWHYFNQLKQHWLKNTPDARPEDFDSSEAKLDPENYISKFTGRKRFKPVELSTVKPKLELSGRDLAKTITYDVSPKNPSTKTIFAEDLATLYQKGGRGISPTSGTFAAFYPTETDEARAETNNENVVPADVNERQLTSARAAGGKTLGRKEQVKLVTPPEAPEVVDRSTMTSGKVVSGNAEVTPVVEAAIRAKRGLNVHFEDGRGAGA
jgi:hypothetical protein